MLRQPCSKIMFLTALIFVLTTLCSVSEADVEQIQSCNRNFSPSQDVPIIREQTITITVRGNCTDKATYSANSELNLTKGNTGGGTGTQIFAKLTMKPSASIGSGRHHITAHIPLIPGFCVSHDQDFFVDINTPKINQITISPNDTTVTKGRLVAVTVSGNSLSQVSLDSSSSGQVFTNLRVVSNNGSTLVLSGNMQTSKFFHSSDFADSRTDCVDLPGSGSLNVTVDKPDIVPLGPFVYKIGNSDNCGLLDNRDGSQPFDTLDKLCSSIPAPTQQNPHIEQQFNTGGIGWGFRNAKPDFEIEGSFSMVLKNGINTLQQVTVTNTQAANTRLDVNFLRPENRRLLQRDFNCPRCIDRNIAPFNWTDPGTITVVVDNTTAIDEGSFENNNTAQVPQ